MGAEVYPFVKATGVYHCPDDIYDVSYALNYNLSQVALSQFSAPASTVLLYECLGVGNLFIPLIATNPPPITITTPGIGDAISPAGDGITVVSTFPPAAGGTPVISGTADQISPRHDNNPGSYAANYLLEDGHVKFLKLPTISAGKDAGAASTPEAAGANAAGTGSMAAPRIATFSFN